MTQDELDEIWKRHLAGGPMGTDEQAWTDPDGNERIHRGPGDWERKTGAKPWDPVLPAGGNFPTQVSGK